jgi:hypothetical protein
VEKVKLEELLGRLRTAGSPSELETVLVELTSRSRLGAHVDPEVAGAISAQTALRVNALDTESLLLLKGAGRRELDQIARYLSEDAVLTEKLFNEFRAELVEYVRFNPTGSVRNVEKALRQTKTRTPGFVESVDPDVDPPGLGFHNTEYVWRAGKKEPKDADGWQDGVRYIETQIYGPGGSVGFFERTYDPTTGVVEMKMAFLRVGAGVKAIPSKMTHAGQHMAGDVTPTIHYMNVYQLKRLGVPIGGAEGTALKDIVMSTIENVETIAHLHWLRQEFPNMTDGERIAKTASVRYATGSLRQMGYEPVGSFEITPGHKAPIKHLLDDQGDAALMKQNDELLADYGFNRDTWMEMDFDITFSVAPK